MKYKLKKIGLIVAAAGMVMNLVDDGSDPNGNLFGAGAPLAGLQTAEINGLVKVGIPINSAPYFPMFLIWSGAAAFAAGYFLTRKRS